MATVTWNANKDNVSSADYGSGVDIHLPVGYMSWLPGYARAFIGFSYSWSGWTAINSATLYLRTDDEYHGSHGSDPDIYVDLITASWSEGSSASGETWHSADDISPTCSSANRVTWDVGGGSAPSTNTWYSVSITNMIRQAWANGTFYGVRLMSTDEGDAGERIGFWSTEKGTSYDAYIVVDYSTNTAPTAPTNLSPTGDTIVQNLTPTFTATFNDPDAGEVMANYQILVYEDNGTTLKWDSGTIAGSTINKVYNGPALTGNTFYRWTVRAQDDGGAWGPYQPTQSRFKVNSVPNAPTLALVESPTTDIKTLTPTFSITHSDPDASDSQMTAYRLFVWNSGWGGVWDTGYVAVTPTATKQVLYAGPALSWNSTYYWSAYTYDSNGATYGNWGSYPAFTTHKTGTAISLSPTGGTVVSLDGSGNPMPTFSGSRASTADLLTNAYIKVFAAADLVNPIWTSSSNSGVTSSGFSRAYGGATLSYSASYAWQVQVTSSIGGDSDWSALQYFTTPAAGSITMTAPVSPVTDTTPDFTFGRATNFNAWNLIVYSMADAVLWDSGTQTMTAGTSKTVTYATGGTVNLATLAFGTSYKWKVRVSADSGSTWGSGYTGLVQFNMDSALVPVLGSPTSDAWLGAPEVLDDYDDITGFTNGANLTAAFEGTTKQVGRGSVKLTGTFSGAQMAYRTLPSPINLSKYGAQTPIKIWAYIDSLTSVTSLKVRFEFGATIGANYDEYIITPSAGAAWQEKTVTKGSPSVAAGTRNWADVQRIGIVATYGASVGRTIYVDDLRIDGTAPSFDGTTSGGETISTYRIRVYPTSDGSGAATWDSGDVAGSGTTFSKLYTGTTLSKGVTYYWQASYVKSSGAPGAYSSLYPFILNSDPSLPSGLSPASGAIVADDLTPTFTSTFNDNDKTTRGDAPTVYEVEVYRNSDSVLAYSLFKDASLIAGTNSVTDGDAGILKVTGAANPIAYETEYKYRSRYRDSMGAIGSWTSYTVFKPSQSPTATLNVPADTATLTSPAVNITWSHSSPGGKAQNSYQLVIYRVDTESTIFDSGRLYTSVNSYAYPAGTLVNGKSYEFRLKTWDTDGLESAWDINTASTNWTAPDPITDFIAVADESRSAVICRWTQSNTAPGSFRKYTIYRKKTSEFNWNLLAEIVNQSTVEYADYLTANTVSYDYKITQWSIVVGDADLESGDSDLASEVLDTDSWYVVGADRNPAHIFEVPVSAAPFVEPVQQEVFEPLGTSRKVIVRGKALGAEGSLQCRWKDAERETARAQVDYIKNNAGPHILKSPFGDIWFVEFSGPSKDYMGGGHVNVTLVWTEVE
jgi:hypothetical protein